MKSFNRQTGRFAENLAAKALRDKGYQILEHNFANRFGEIDIIAKDKGTLVFIEVKAKKGERFGAPEDMISRGKLKKIQKMASVYLNGRKLLCRIDVVAIVLSPTNEIIRFSHYENVYI